MVCIADRFNAKMNSNFGTAANLSGFLITEIVQSVEQKPFPLLLGIECQRRCGNQAFFNKCQSLHNRMAASSLYAAG